MLEVELGEMEAAFGFSTEKRWKTTIYLYFSESGRPKTDTRKFLMHFGAWGAVDRREGHVATADWPAHASRSTEWSAGVVDREGATWRPRIGGRRWLGPRERAAGCVDWAGDTWLLVIGSVQWARRTRGVRGQAGQMRR